MVADFEGDGKTDLLVTGFTQVPAALYPRSAATAATMAAFITTGQFTWGLDRVLDGACGS